MTENRTRQTGYHKTRELINQIRKCHDVSCGIIERDNRPPSMVTMPKPRHMTRWSSGFCKLCGEHMDLLTHYHAGLHGYQSAEAMIKDGKYAFD